MKGKFVRRWRDRRSPSLALRIYGSKKPYDSLAAFRRESHNYVSHVSVRRQPPFLHGVAQDRQIALQVLNVTRKRDIDTRAQDRTAACAAGGQAKEVRADEPLTSHNNAHKP